MVESIDASRELLIRLTRRPTYLLRRSLPRRGGSRAIAGYSSAGIRKRVVFQWRDLTIGARLGPARRDVSARRNEMHPEELMKPDLFSEIVLLGSGGLIFVSLLPDRSGCAYPSLNVQ